MRFNNNAACTNKKIMRDNERLRLEVLQQDLLCLSPQVLCFLELSVDTCTGLSINFHIRAVKRPFSPRPHSTESPKWLFALPFQRVGLLWGQKAQRNCLHPAAVQPVGAPNKMARKDHEKLQLRTLVQLYSRRALIAMDNKCYGRHQSCNLQHIRRAKMPKHEPHEAKIWELQP